MRPKSGDGDDDEVPDNPKPRLGPGGGGNELIVFYVYVKRDSATTG